MRGFSLQDLSNSLSNRLNKQALQRLESGQNRPDSEIISQLASALRLPGDFFFRVSSVELDELRFRKLKKLPVREQEKVQANTIDFLERYLELEDILGISGKLSFRPKEFQIHSQTDIENAAMQLRKDWKLGEDPLPNILEMLEENNVKVYLLDADHSFSGMSTVLANGMAVIVLNRHENIPLVRLRFSALHELAHLYLDLSRFDEKQSEKFCDAFASAVLLPAGKIRETLGNHRTQLFLKELAIIAGQYGISLAAIAYRAFSLGIISASYHKYFMIRYNRDRIREKEFTVYKGQEKAQRFLQLLIRAVAEEVISTSKAASLFNQKLGDFRALLDNAMP